MDVLNGKSERVAETTRSFHIPASNFYKFPGPLFPACLLQSCNIEPGRVLIYLQCSPHPNAVEYHAPGHISYFQVQRILGRKTFTLRYKEKYLLRSRIRVNLQYRMFRLLLTC